MKTTAKLACCVVALAWMFNASAKEEVMSSPMAADDEVSDSASAAEEGSEDAIKGNSSVMAMPAAGTDSSANSAPAAEDVAVATPPAPRVPVMAHTEKVDRTAVERKMEDRSNRAKKRTADAEKDVAARTQQSQANAVAQ